MTDGAAGRSARSDEVHDSTVRRYTHDSFFPCCRPLPVHRVSTRVRGRCIGAGLGAGLAVIGAGIGIGRIGGQADGRHGASAGNRPARIQTGALILAALIEGVALFARRRRLLIQGSSSSNVAAPRARRPGGRARGTSHLFEILHAHAFALGRSCSSGQRRARLRPGRRGASRRRRVDGTSSNLMFWTLLIFVVLYFILSKFAFGPITAAVEAREKALEEAIDGAKRDRDAGREAARRAPGAIDAARGEAQKIIAEGRAVAEKMRADMLEQTRKEQQEHARARPPRDRERARQARSPQLRREAVDLAIAGASKVIEQNLESQKNRQLVESYLASIGSLEGEPLNARAHDRPELRRDAARARAARRATCAAGAR